MTWLCSQALPMSSHRPCSKHILTSSDSSSSSFYSYCDAMQIGKAMHVGFWHSVSLPVLGDCIKGLPVTTVQRMVSIRARTRSAGQAK